MTRTLTDIKEKTTGLNLLQTPDWKLAACDHDLQTDLYYNNLNPPLADRTNNIC